MGVIEMSMEKFRNEKAGGNGRSRENPPTSVIGRHDSHIWRIREWPGRGLNPVRLGERRAGQPLRRAIEAPVYRFRLGHWTTSWLSRRVCRTGQYDARRGRRGETTNIIDYAEYEIEIYIKKKPGEPRDLRLKNGTSDSMVQENLDTSSLRTEDTEKIGYGWPTSNWTLLKPSIFTCACAGAKKQLPDTCLKAVHNEVCTFVMNPGKMSLLLRGIHFNGFTKWHAPSEVVLLTKEKAVRCWNSGCGYCVVGIRSLPCIDFKVGTRRWLLRKEVVPGVETKHSPPTKANRVRFPVESRLDFHKWESCRRYTDGRRVFSEISSFPAHLCSGTAPHSPPTEANRIRIPVESRLDFHKSPVFFRHCSALASLHPHRLSRPRSKLSTPPVTTFPVRSHRGGRIHNWQKIELEQGCEKFRPAGRRGVTLGPDTASSSPGAVCGLTAGEQHCALLGRFPGSLATPPPPYHIRAPTTPSLYRKRLFVVLEENYAPRVLHEDERVLKRLACGRGGAGSTGDKFPRSKCHTDTWIARGPIDRDVRISRLYRCEIRFQGVQKQNLHLRCIIAGIKYERTREARSYVTGEKCCREVCAGQIPRRKRDCFRCTSGARLCPRTWCKQHIEEAGTQCMYKQPGKESIAVCRKQTRLLPKTGDDARTTILRNISLAPEKKKKNAKEGTEFLGTEYLKPCRAVFHRYTLRRCKYQWDCNEQLTHTQRAKVADEHFSDLF
ncbi:hypothetical protein PR048_000809 [Dryococelus australis]|uniref:Uncharacterized protein n=1 Tax=Dryococelus australis TaxID=614101 RepID=A0ABQ9IGJ6_9NEOP|nr:hypothetical protein PR048_000809 [Dryococelus australis]